MGARTEMSVANAKADGFGDAQARLEHHQQQRPVAAAEPGGAVGARHQGLHLVAGKEVHDGLVVAFRRDPQNLLERLAQRATAMANVTVRNIDDQIAEDRGRDRERLELLRTLPELFKSRRAESAL